MAARFETGDWVVYRKTKHGPHPGPRAQQVNPSRSGDQYGYLVDKFWVVREVHTDGRLVLETRRGKRHIVPVDDPSLRRASWWQRLRFRARFEAIVSGKGRDEERARDADAAASGDD